MTAAWITGLIMGAIGSLHCIGMCGPLALSLPVAGDQMKRKFIGTFLYNAGRVATYASLGVITGLLGRSFAINGYQQVLSVSLGILIIAFVLLPKLGQKLGDGKIFAGFFNRLRSAIGKLYQAKTYSSLFLIGVLNGLLPCGLVYMALAASASMGSVGMGSLFMAGFGMGTLPVMWSVAFFGGFIHMNIRQRIRKLYPYLMVAMACLLIIRGLGLGIPYLSPSFDTGHQMENNIDCHN